MKKIISVVLAVAMILSMGTIAAFAAGVPATLEAAVVGKAPAAVGDVFKIEVQVKDVGTNTFSGVTASIGYNPAVVVPVAATLAADGSVSSFVEATKPAQAIVYRDDVYDADEETGVFAYTGRNWDSAAGTARCSLYIHQDQTELPGVETTGITMTDKYAAPFTVMSMYFVAKAEGDAQIALRDDYSIYNYAPGMEAELKLVSPSITIGGAPVEKTITNIVAPVVAETAKVGDTVNLPATVKATADGAEVELPITWNPASVDTSVANDVTVTGTVDTTGYKVGEGVVTTYTFTVKVEAKQPEPPVEKTITNIVAPVVAETAKVGDTVKLPATVKATADGAEVELPINWNPASVDTGAANNVTVTGTVDTTGYKVGEGVVTTYTFTVKVEEEEKPPVEKTITNIVAPVVAETAKVGDTVELPATVKATADGAEVELPITWDPASVDTGAAKDVTVTGTVDTTGYTVGEGVVTTYTFTVKVEEEEEPPVPDTTIDSIDVPEGVTVYVGATADDVREALGDTVIGHVTDTETVEIPVAWGNVSTRKVATVTVTGTLEVPEGYTLARGLSKSVKATVKVVAVPADNTIDSVVAPAPIIVYTDDAVTLPETVIGVVNDDLTVEVPVAWAEVDTAEAGAKTVVGTLTAPDGYQLAEGLETVEITVTVVAIADLPVEVEAEVSENKDKISIPVVIKEDYTDFTLGDGKTLDDYDTLYVVLTYMDGITPVHVAGQAITKTEGTDTWAGFNYTVEIIDTVPEAADAAQYCVVVGYNPLEPVSETNLGIPVGAARPKDLK